MQLKAREPRSWNTPFPQQYSSCKTWLTCPLWQGIPASVTPCPHRQVFLAHQTENRDGDFVPVSLLDLEFPKRRDFFFPYSSLHTLEPKVVLETYWELQTSLSLRSQRQKKKVLAAVLGL